MTEFWLVPLALVTSTVAGVFGMGGGVPLIAVMPGLVPAAAIIPLHAATQLASNGSRALFAWRHIDLAMIPPFLLGGALGVLTGGWIYAQIDLGWLPAIIGIAILILTWFPLPKLAGDGRWALALLGFYQTGVGMIAGATGPLGAAVLARRNSRKDWLVVNTAVYMSVNHLLRSIAFLVMGFAFIDYAWLLAGMVAGVVTGSWLGTRLRALVPEINFQFWFRWLVTLLAVRMIIVGVWP